jgi:2-dehydropantoate 2-reductase
MIHMATFPSRTVFTDDGVAAIARDLIAECWTVGRAAGVDLDLDKVGPTVDGIAKAGRGRTSMLHDMEAGRPTEHDAIHGAVLRLGEHHGVATPVTRMVHDLLAASRVNQTGG